MRAVSEAAAETRTLVRVDASRVAGFALLVIDGPSAGARARSVAGGRCQIGSGPDVNLRLDDRAVSRLHCEVVGGSGGVTVRDLGSKNGVILDGVPVREAEIRHGSTLRIGQSAIRVELAGLVDRLPPSERDSFGTLVGRSRAMRELFTVLERLAAVESTVLILGETGTGKEEAGRSLHQASARRSGPYVVVDCGAIAQGLIESELFGHVQGGFTGAERERDGAFASASGGTLFLDEIGELPRAQQSRLLRVLESHSVRPVGASDYRAVDVRVIVATHRDLSEEVAQGRFREDLFFRLAVSQVELPPLRERPEDLERLIPSLLDRLALPVDDPLRADLLGPNSLAVLQSGAWPGNVRELRNHLELCVAQRRVVPVLAATVPQAAPAAEAGDYRAGLKQVIERYEKTYVERMLETCGGNVSEAIRRAGIGRATMYQLINRHLPPRR